MYQTVNTFLLYRLQNFFLSLFLLPSLPSLPLRSEVPLFFFFILVHLLVAHLPNLVI